MSIHGMKTTKPDDTSRSPGGGLPTANAQKVGESGLSTSDTGKMLEIFPRTPYNDGYNLEDIATLTVVGELLHGSDPVPTIPGWAPEGVVLSYAHPEVPDQNALTVDNQNQPLPQPAYAPFADVLGTVDPHVPAVYDPSATEQGSDGLKQPTVTGPRVYKTLADYMNGVGSGINVHNGT